MARDTPIHLPHTPPHCCGLVWDYDKVGQCDFIQHSKPRQQGRQQWCLGESVDFFLGQREAKGQKHIPAVYFCSSTCVLALFPFFFHSMQLGFILSVYCGMCIKV